MAIHWRIQLLGGLRAEQTGAALEREARVITRFQTQKTAALLAYLAYYGQRAHPREQLIELLWPECAPDAGRNRLSQALSWLRRQLEPPGVPAHSVIAADRAAVRLNPESVSTDAAAFVTALQAAKRAPGRVERVQHLATAVELYRGELLPGFYESWVLQEREWLAERSFQGLDRLMALLEQQGEVERALEYAHRAVSADPLREEAHRALIRLLAAAGQPAAALRHYNQLQEILKQELGAQPAAATRALAREIERLSLLRQPSATGPQIAPPQPATPPREQPPAQAEGEYRLVSVLVADAGRCVPTTESLPLEDAAALRHRLLKAMLDVVTQYEGRVDRFLEDGILAVFGVPQAHEEDPERAVRAALAIRAAAHDLGLDIAAGINTGQLYIGGDERLPGAAGPVVSLAARLQEQAEPAQILVGEATYRQTRLAFQFSALSLQIEGMASPVAARAVARALPRPEKTRGIEGRRADLIGRDEEFTRLKAALADVLRGQGQMVSVIGEAGVGKSRLVAELKSVFGVRSSVFGSVAPNTEDRTPNTEHRLLWLEGRCLELGMTTSYALFVDLFRDFFAWRPEEDEHARGERLAACLREFVTREELSEERSQEIGPLLGNLLSLRFGTDWDARLKNASPEQIKHQTFLAVRDFFLTLARRQPTVLVFEDLHWADSLSLDLISLLMESLTVAPLFLLCVYRPEREHRSWRLGELAARKFPERSTEIRLRELTRRQSCQLLESLLGSEKLSSPVSELIWERSRGNPFFMEEVIRSLADAGAVCQEWDEWPIQTGIESCAVPESIQSAVLSRVDRLGQDARGVLQHAAVIGRLFRRRLLERTLPGTTLDATLWDLEDRAFIYRERVVPEEEYSFEHALTQETIYGSIPRRQRALLHQQVAEAIEGLSAEGLEEHYEQLASHYERSGHDEKAVEYLLKAGEKSRRAYLNEEAIGYFQRALERLSQSPLGDTRRDWRLEALRGLGRTCLGVDKVTQAEEWLRQAIALGRESGLEPGPLARLHFWLGDAVYWQRRYDELLRLGEEGRALLGQDTESVEAALANVCLGLGHACNGDIEQYRALHHRNAQFLELLPYSEELRPAYSLLVDVYLHQDRNVEAGMKWIRALQRNAEQHHDLRAAGVAHFYMGSVLHTEGRLNEAISQRQQALELFTRIGDTKQVSCCLHPLEMAFLELGELQKAKECALRVIELTEGLGNRKHRCHAYLTLGTVLLCEGSAAGAVDSFRRAVQLAHEIDPSWEAGATNTLGQAYRALGERLEAARQFERAFALVKPDLSAEWVASICASALMGLEAVCDSPEEFRALCHRLRAEHPEVERSPLVQWYLEPAEPHGFSLPWIHERFATLLPSDWTWHDPLGDCSFTVRNGLEIRAANGRDLWYTQESAPRFLRAARGDFAIQTACMPASREKPARGGLLLWKDQGHFLRLDRRAGEHEISLMGHVANQKIGAGRGRLPCERVFLRLERQGGRVRALCSADGEEWFTVGQVEFPVEGPIEVGLYAIGSIDRILYPGAYPDGTAIRFESFDAWR